MTKPDAIAEMIATTVRELAGSISWSTTPASSMSRRSSSFRSRNGTRSSRSIFPPRSTPCGWRCRRCAEQIRPHHQHRLGAWPGRLAIQGRLCRRQAWHRRPDQGHGAGGGGARHHLQRHLPGLRLHAAGRGPDRRPGKAHGISREQVIRDVLLAQQPNKRFATVEEIGALTLFLASEAAHRSPASPCRSTAAGPRIERSG